jgi:alginate O-acetyltransferase complex protein AlgI
MLFNSLNFIFLVIATFIIYYFPPAKKFQKIILVISSLIFFSIGQPRLTLILILTIAITTTTSYLVLNSPATLKKVWSICGITLNLVILVIFKYGAFLSKTFIQSGSSIGKFMMTIPLPLGISFFIFKGISLTIDSFRNNDKKNPSMQTGVVEHSLSSFMYISFFPQLLAGPIQPAADFFTQINTKYLKDIDWEYIVKILILGYFLKMVIADNLKDQTFWIAYPYFQAHSPFTLVVMLYGYSMQMFADFAGYSLIAIGISSLFGYRVKDNFYFPYISKSFSEFWRRWHISLSTFFRDYVYIPLGGSRKGKSRTYVNLLGVMVLCGLWHGAGWSYILWGALHGVALALERFGKSVITVPDNKILNAIRMIVVFCLVSFAWIFFKLPDFSHVVKYIEAIRLNSVSMSVHASMICINIILYSVPVILYHVLYLLESRSFIIKLQKFEYILYGMLLFSIITNSGSPNSFIYFQF